MPNSFPELGETFTRACMGFGFSVKTKPDKPVLITIVKWHLYFTQMDLSILHLKANMVLEATVTSRTTHISTLPGIP